LSTVDLNLGRTLCSADGTVDTRDVPALIHLYVAHQDSGMLSERFYSNHPSSRTTLCHLQREVTDVCTDIHHDIMVRQVDMSGTQIRIHNEGFVDDAQIPAAGPNVKPQTAAKLQ